MTWKPQVDDQWRRAAAAARNSSLDSFLESRSLAKAELVDEARALGGPGEIYFVSTIVTGLGGSTSDIDVIVIADQSEADGPRMSTMAFFQGSRLGAKRYSRPEFEVASDRLSSLVALPASELASGIENWQEPIALIDLERLINGVTACGTCPLIDHLPDLAAARFAFSFDQSRESLMLAALAARAGEARAPWGYLLQGLLHLMDAAMACDGSVVTNVKWTAQRWRQSATSRDPRWALIDDWWIRARRALANAAEAPSAGDFISVYATVASAFGFSPAEDADVLRWRNDIVSQPFGASVWLSRSPSGRMALHPTPGERRPIALGDVAVLESVEAMTLLNAARAGFVSARLREACLRAPLRFLGLRGE